MVDLRKARTIALLVATLMGTSIPFAYAMEDDQTEQRTPQGLSQLPFKDIKVDPETPQRLLSLVVSIKNREEEAFRALPCDEGKKMIELLFYSYHSLPEDKQTTKFRSVKLAKNSENAFRFKEKESDEASSYRLLLSSDVNNNLQIMLGAYTKAFEEEEEVRKQKAFEIEQAQIKAQEEAEEQAEFQRQFERDKAEREAAIVKQQKKEQERAIANLSALFSLQAVVSQAEQEKLQQERLQQENLRIQAEVKRQFELLEQQKREFEAARQRVAEEAARQKAAVEAKKRAEEVERQRIAEEQLRQAEAQRQEQVRRAQDLLLQATQGLDGWIGGIHAKLSRHNARVEQRGANEKYKAYTRGKAVKNHYLAVAAWEDTANNALVTLAATDDYLFEVLYAKSLTPNGFRARDGQPSLTERLKKAKLRQIKRDLGIGEDADV